MVTGVPGATANNSYGIAGVASCYDNSVLDDITVVDVFNEVDFMHTDAQALYYAQEKGAKVINMSFQCPTGGKYPNIEKACRLLTEDGIVLVAAAGNDTKNNYVEPSDIDSVISVMATDQSNQRASFSAYGPNKDICAPGTNIYTTCDRTSTTSSSDFVAGMEGTSLSAPLVTGTVAMMLSVNPRLTPSQVKTLLYSTATDRGCRSFRSGI